MSSGRGGSITMAAVAALLMFGTSMFISRASGLKLIPTGLLVSVVAGVGVFMAISLARRHRR